MNTPSDQQITGRGILEVNARAAGGILALFYSWLSWQMISPEWWGFWLISVLSGVGGAILLIQAAVKTRQLILGQRRWTALTRQGATPRADKQPGREDFKNEGIIR